MDPTQVMNTLGQAFGALEKAVLYFEPLKDGEVTTEAAVSQGSSGGWGSALKDAAKSAGKAALNSAAGVIGLDPSLFGDKEGAPNTFYVQFNPASISFDATATLPEDKTKQTANPSEPGSTPASERGSVQAFLKGNDVNIRMNIQLVFNDVNVDDAFLGNRLSPISGEAVQSLAKSAVKMSGYNKKGFSVRDDVQALTYACRSNKFRRCHFIWGNTTMKGLLDGVDAQYKMFNTKGEPIHAVVNISMLLLDGAPEVDTWDEMYKEAFGTGSGYVRAKDNGVIGDALGSVGGFINTSL